jgi:hypothetical protein
MSKSCRSQGFSANLAGFGPAFAARALSRLEGRYWIENPEFFSDSAPTCRNLIPARRLPLKSK